MTQWTRELIEGKWPLSIDHLDFNISNAAVQENGEILIFDWEEATISSPFFSLERLLCDADDFEEKPEEMRRSEGDLFLTANQMAIRNAYIDALPWQTKNERGRAFDLAMCLAPIKTAYECEPFCQALDREYFLPKHTAFCFGRALPFWRAMNGA